MAACLLPPLAAPSWARLHSQPVGRASRQPGRRWLPPFARATAPCRRVCTLQQTMAAPEAPWRDCSSHWRRWWCQRSPRAQARGRPLSTAHHDARGILPGIMQQPTRTNASCSYTPSTTSPQRTLERPVSTARALCPSARRVPAWRLRTPRGHSVRSKTWRWPWPVRSRRTLSMGESKARRAVCLLGLYSYAVCLSRPHARVGRCRESRTFCVVSSPRSRSSWKLCTGACGWRRQQPRRGAHGQ